MGTVIHKSHGPPPASQTSLYVFGLSERFRGRFLSCRYEEFSATMIGKGGMAVEGQPAKLMGMSWSSSMHVHSRGLGNFRGGSEQDKPREEEIAPSAPARVSAHKRRVFASLEFRVVPYFSLELIDMFLFLCAYHVVRTVQQSR